MQAGVVAVACERLEGLADAITPSRDTARVLAARGLPVRHADPARTPAGTVDGVVLLGDELGADPDHAELRLAEAAAALVPGGLVIASVRGAVHAAATGAPTAGALRAAELEGLLGHRGFAVELLCAPGAARALGGRRPAYEPALDRVTGLLDAGTVIVGVGRRHVDEASRSAAFFRSLPRKVVAAAVVCRLGDRLLVVHDSFKRHWTIPGGVVDADESPRDGAEREAWEEAGVRVHAGALLGLFAESWPDRLVLLYEAEAIDPPTDPEPRHPHEISAVAWLPLEEAVARLNPRTASQVRRCLQAPGTTWHDS